MAYLLDSHTILWFAEGSESLSILARETILTADPGNVYFSCARPNSDHIPCQINPVLIVEFDGADSRTPEVSGEALREDFIDIILP
jgi:hypothetical protein